MLSINKNIEILDDEYINSNTKLKCKCLNINCNYIWHANWSNLSFGKGCPACNSNILSDKNRLSIIRPDLIKYFKNKTDAYNCSIRSNKIFDCICPDCGYEKRLSAETLYSSGFCCNKCRIGGHLPERFVSSLLKELGVNYIQQYSPVWSNRRYYDFFIKDYNMIIEVHGEQHYKQSKRGRPLEEEESNDLYKKTTAINNGIEDKNYIIIDARKSNLQYLKESCIISLSGLFELCNIDWINIFEKSQKSIVKEVCDYWNNKDELETAESVSKIFNINKTTIISYLKDGTDIGWCCYDPKYEMLKTGQKNGGSGAKKIYKYDTDMNLICEYESAHAAARDVGVSVTGISECANKKQKTSAGYIWRYELISTKEE